MGENDTVDASWHQHVPQNSRWADTQQGTESLTTYHSHFDDGTMTPRSPSVPWCTVQKERGFIVRCKPSTKHGTKLIEEVQAFHFIVLRVSLDGLIVGVVCLFQDETGGGDRNLHPQHIV